MNIRYFNKLTELLPEPVRKFGGLVSLTLAVIFSFAILNVFFGQGDELVEKMKKEEARIAEANKLSKIISTLPSGILTFYEASDHYKLSKEQYETVCKITKIKIPDGSVEIILLNLLASAILASSFFIFSTNSSP